MEIYEICRLATKIANPLNPCQPERRTRLQEAVIHLALSKVISFACRLDKVSNPLDSADALSCLLGPADGRSTDVTPLKADECDLHPNAAQVTKRLLIQKFDLLGIIPFGEEVLADSFVQPTPWQILLFGSLCYSP